MITKVLVSSVESQVISSLRSRDFLFIYSFINYLNYIISHSLAQESFVKEPKSQEFLQLLIKDEAQANILTLSISFYTL